jgi:hypothetical protein
MEIADLLPSTMFEFEEQFRDESDCISYLKKLRWPDGFRCPKCDHAQGWETADALIICQHCGYKSSLTAGTSFHQTHKPLMFWFRAIWFVTNQKNGVSAPGLQRALGLGSYHTAWTWLQETETADAPHPIPGPTSA